MIDVSLAPTLCVLTDVNSKWGYGGHVVDVHVGFMQVTLDCVPKVYSQFFVTFNYKHDLHIYSVF